MIYPFPFSAIVGQDGLKKALMLIAVDSGIGGLLISGSRGSAKSTAVRALGSLIPNSPFVDIPLGATEEMVTGTLDLDHALSESGVRFKPGLLAKADRGVLYVDEVNLLPDHLVDLLLDVSASGTNIVERDGVSHHHSARFLLVGTMNPDEGELRPQLLDRFGLMVEMEQIYSLEQRMEIVNKRLEYDSDPEKFIQANKGVLQNLQNQLTGARNRVAEVKVDRPACESIAARCASANVEGLRADIVMRRAAIAHAALRESTRVTQDDLDAVEELVLAHRRRNQPETGKSSSSSGGSSGSGPTRGTPEETKSSIQGSWGAMPTVTTEALSGRVLPFDSPAPAMSLTGLHPNTGKRGQGNFHSTRYIPVQETKKRRVDWFRSLLSMKDQNPGQRSKRELQYRYAIIGKIDLDLVLLDTSASTLSGQGLGHAKGVIAALSRQGYVNRRHLGIISFGNNQVKTLLYPQRSPKNISLLLDTVPAGGGTPILSALDVTENLLFRHRVKTMNCNLYLITDGRLDASAANRAIWRDYPVTLVDIESGRVKLEMARNFAHHIHANYVHISSLPRSTLH